MSVALSALSTGMTLPKIDAAAAASKPDVRSDDNGVGFAFCIGLGMMAAIGWFIRVLTKSPPPSKSLAKAVEGQVRQEDVVELELEGLIMEQCQLLMGSPKSFGRRSTISALESPLRTSPDTVFAPSSPPANSWTNLDLSAPSPPFLGPTPQLSSRGLPTVAAAAATKPKPDGARFEALLGGSALSRNVVNGASTTRRRVAPMRRTDDRREALLDGRISPSLVTTVAPKRLAPTSTAAPAPTPPPCTPATVEVAKMAPAARAQSRGKTPPALKRSTSIYDASLRAAFASVDTDCSGVLSKRQLYAALARVGLTLTPAEQLRIWKLFDRDANGSIDWDEFRALGAALLELSDARPRANGALSKAQERGGFAQRSYDDRQKMILAAERIQGLARQRSLEHVRLSAVKKAL